LLSLTLLFFLASTVVSESACLSTVSVLGAATRDAWSVVVPPLPPGSGLTVSVDPPAPTFVAAAGSGKDVKWTMVPEATLKQAEFMVDVGTIKVKPKSWKDYFFPEAYGLPGG